MISYLSIQSRQWQDRALVSIYVDRYKMTTLSCLPQSPRSQLWMKMSSPDERQGDAHAGCSSYFCSLGPEHSVPCTKANVLRTKVLEVLLPNNLVPEPNEDRGTDSDVRPSPPRERNDLNNTIKGTSTDGPLDTANSNIEMPATIPSTHEGRQLAVSVWQNLSEFFDEWYWMLPISPLK